MSLIADDMLIVFCIHEGHWARLRTNPAHVSLATKRFVLLTRPEDMVPGLDPFSTLVKILSFHLTSMIREEPSSLGVTNILVFIVRHIVSCTLSYLSGLRTS